MQQTRSFAAAARPRLLPNAAFFGIVWPLLTVIGAARVGLEQPLASKLPVKAALAGALGGAMNLVPELLAVSAIACLASVTTFAAAASLCRAGIERGLALVVEPLGFLLASIVGTAAEYPAVLRHPLLAPCRLLSVRAASIVLALVAVYAVAIVPVARRNLRAAAAGAVASIASAAFVFAVVRAPLRATGGVAPTGSTFLVGLDSLSQIDSLASLRDAVIGLGGAWYENAITPGLLTNSVWPAILEHRPVHETGVFLTYQPPDWRRSPYHLVVEAKRHGLETWSFFSDQFTTYVGSDGGFDVDRSGPKGWLQIATAAVKDANIFAAVLVPRLPPIPFARTPRNQSGTLAFSLDAELGAIFTAGSGKPVFAAAHVDYLHQPVYPRFSEMRDEERARVWRAPVDAVRDLSLDWQYPHVPGEPLDIYAWKIRRLQRAVVTALDRTGVADPRRGNRIVLFSDHGDRTGMTIETFGQPRYYNVVLATVGLRARDSTATISLLDIPLLLAWPDGSRPGKSEPVVEYTNVSTVTDWLAMMAGASLRADGAVGLDERIVARLAGTLKAYVPAEGRYVNAPVVPTVRLTAP